MPPKRKRRSLPWRDFLTKEEAKELAAADEAKRRWLELNRGRAAIVNRAIGRAKYDAGVKR